MRRIPPKFLVSSLILVSICLIVLLSWLSWVSVKKVLSSIGKETEVSRGEVGSRKSLKGFPAFARLESANLTLYLPAEGQEVTGIGYHQAENPRTYTLQPIGYCLKNENEAASQSLSIIKGDVPFFIMNTRGRKQTATSAVDVAVKPNTIIRSPVDGTITRIKPYLMYGRYQDFHLEIQPVGHPELRVAIIHIDKLKVQVGDQVKHKETILGEIRSFTRHIQSQIDRYTPGNFGHIHLQVNPYIPEGEEVPGT